MIKTTNKFLLLAVFIGLLGCSSADDADVNRIPDKSAQALFLDAKEALSKGSYQEAVLILSAIDSRFPFGPISHQVQLDLIYANYKLGDAPQGIALTDRFLRLNPNHPNADYVYYMRALINLSTEEDLIQEAAGIDRSNRDPTASRSAFNDLKIILTQYPDSKYATDATKRMIEIKSRLAQYELAVARYSMKREAYASAANRGRYIVEYFSPSEEVEEALEIMIDAYDKLGLPDLKNNAKKVLAVNYPNSPLLNQ